MSKFMGSCYLVIDQITVYKPSCVCILSPATYNFTNYNTDNYLHERTKTDI